MSQFGSVWADFADSIFIKYQVTGAQLGIVRAVIQSMNKGTPKHFKEDTARD